MRMKALFVVILGGLLAADRLELRFDIGSLRSHGEQLHTAFKFVVVARATVFSAALGAQATAIFKVIRHMLIVLVVPRVVVVLVV